MFEGLRRAIRALLAAGLASVIIILTLPSVFGVGNVWLAFLSQPLMTLAYIALVYVFSLFIVWAAQRSAPSRKPEEG